MNNRPVWLLDVDGVINAPDPGWGAAPHSDHVYPGGPRHMCWAPALITRIRALHDSGRVDIRWCSTWCSDADRLEALFGLPRLDRAWYDRLTSTAAAAAKLAAARDILDRDRPLIWTDDTEVPASGPVHDELTRRGRTLLIAPSPRHGLQPDHLDAIEAFVASAARTGTARPS